MQNKKMCRYCEREINLDVDKLVLLGTYEERSALDESYFHFDCFVDWFNDKLEEKQGKTKQLPKKQNPTNNLNDIQKIAGDIMGGMDLNNLMGGVDFGGIDLKGDANKISEGIKKTAGRITKKNNAKSKKKTGGKANKK